MNRKKDKAKVITLNNQPDWYSQYSWSPIPDNTDYFVGREIEFKGFWYQMAGLVGCGQGPKRNYAFIGQRKMGKTAYLKRCYNIAFWEQDEVVPFYYSFSQNDGQNDCHVIQMSDLQENMPIEFLRQFFAYCSKDQSFLEKKTIDDILVYAKKIKFSRIDDLEVCIRACLGYINNNRDISMLMHVWQMTQDLSFFVRKKCLLIIDEAQEMEISVFEGDKHCPCKASISDIIQKDHSLVFVSGSNVSMLVNNFLDYSFANRFQKCPFTTLEIEDAKDLIARRCHNGYKNLADDLLHLVGENPYYIDCVLNFNILYSKKYKNEKDFSCREGLHKAYEFEVLDSQGTIYDFWQTHLRKNKKDLNNDPKGKKGLALQLLYKISSHPHKEFTFRELATEFDVKEQTVEQKVEQLVHANLIKPTGVSLFAHAFSDKVLPTIINKVYHNLIIEGPSKSVAQEAVRDYVTIINSCEKQAQDLEQELEKASHRLNNIKKKFLSMNFQLANLDDRVSSALGKMNLQKGIRKENRIRKKIRLMIKKQQHMFSDCRLEGDVHSINISGSQGTGCQIDIFAKLREKNKRKFFTLLAEVKNHKTKIGIGEARKFVASIKRAQQEYKLKNIVAIYISISGFTKGAKKYLESFDIQLARSEQIFTE